MHKYAQWAKMDGGVRVTINVAPGREATWLAVVATAFRVREVTVLDQGGQSKEDEKVVEEESGRPAAPRRQLQRKESEPEKEPQVLRAEGASDKAEVEINVAAAEAAREAQQAPEESHGTLFFNIAENGAPSQTAGFWQGGDIIKNNAKVKHHIPEVVKAMRTCVKRDGWAKANAEQTASRNTYISFQLKDRPVQHHDKVLEQAAEYVKETEARPPDKSVGENHIDKPDHVFVGCCAPLCKAGTCSNKQRVHCAAEEFYEKDLVALIYEVGAEHAKLLIQEHGCRAIELLGIAHALRRTGKLEISNVVDPVDEYAVQQLMEELESTQGGLDLEDEQYSMGCASEAMYMVDPADEDAVHQLIESVVKKLKMTNE